MKRIITIATAALALAVVASGPASASTAKYLDSARTLYQSAHFFEAINMLTELVDGGELNEAQKKDALLLLARASMGKDFADKAAAYLRAILDLDPAWRMNVSAEPPQMRKIWYKTLGEVDTTKPDPGIKTLAVLYFENGSVVDKEAFDPLQKGISQMLVSDLSAIGTGLQVVERERIQYILDEIKMEQTAYFKQETAVRVGKLLGAHSLLMGGFTKLSKKQMRIDARLVKTETGEILKAEKVEGDPEKLLDLVAELAEKMAANMKLAVKPAEKKAMHADAGTPLKALLAYTRALNFEDEGKYQEAYDEYQEALVIYPKHAEAEERMVVLAPHVNPQG